MSPNLYDVIEQYTSAGKKGILATLVRSSGSSPRGAGAKMFVGEDGASFGTVGGGSVEAQTQKRAIEMMGAEAPVLLRFQFQGTQIEDEGMICGGNVDIFLEPVMERHRELYKMIQLCEKRGRKALIATSFGIHPYSKSLLEANGSTYGDADLQPHLPLLQTHFDQQRSLTIDSDRLIEPVIGACNLYIFGAGHVSQYLAKAAKMVDFNVVVIDDREEFANEARFPEADSIMAMGFDRAFEELPFPGNNYVVIVTRGHKHDAQVLEASLKRETAYVGMIGSRRKVRMVLDFLKGKGFTEEALQRVYAPIGIDINSETPQEIAISITAQLIKVRGET